MDGPIHVSTDAHRLIEAFRNLNLLLVLQSDKEWSLHASVQLSASLDAMKIKTK